VIQIRSVAPLTIDQPPDILYSLEGIFSSRAKNKMLLPNPVQKLNIDLCLWPLRICVE